MACAGHYPRELKWPNKNDVFADEGGVLGKKHAKWWLDESGSLLKWECIIFLLYNRGSPLMWRCITINVSPMWQPICFWVHLTFLAMIIPNAIENTVTKLWCMLCSYGQHSRTSCSHTQSSALPPRSNAHPYEIPICLPQSVSGS